MQLEEEWKKELADVDAGTGGQIPEEEDQKTLQEREMRKAYFKGMINL